MGRYCGGEPTIHREFQRALMAEMGREEWADPDEDCELEEDQQEVPIAQ